MCPSPNEVPRGGHRSAHPGQVAGHHVGVPLDDDRLAALRDLAFGQVRPVQHGALMEQGALRRVQVLRPVLVRVELAGAERDHVAGQVADRPHQAAAEAVHRAPAALAGQPAGQQLLLGETAAAQVAGERLPLGGRVPHPEVLRVGQREPALGQERPAGGGGRAVQPLGVELRRHLVRLQQPAALAVLPARHLAALLVPQVDAAPGGEPLHGLHERQVVDLLHELDDVAALGAGEAVPEAAGRGDVERRGLLVVEGAQSLERAATGVAQLEILPDHLVDGRLLADECDVLIADPARHWHPPPSSLLPVAASLVPAADGCSPPRRAPRRPDGYGVTVREPRGSARPHAVTRGARTRAEAGRATPLVPRCGTVAACPACWSCGMWTTP